MTVLVERRDLDGVRILTLNRPEARNALSGALIATFYDALEAADVDGGVRVVVLTGVDPAFCAGVDLKEAARDGEDYFRRFRDTDCIARVATMSKPIIAAVNGATFTGGLEIALGCDFMLASERAVFADTHARVGVLPGGGMTARLPLVVGSAYARRMSMTGEAVGATEALRLGLVTEVVPHEQLMTRAMKLAAGIAEVPSDTMAALKQMYVEGAATTVVPALEAERSVSDRHRPDLAMLEQRRVAVTARNREQIHGGAV
jgi:enoyl-CoA hydratase